MIPVGHGVDIVLVAKIGNLAEDSDWVARCFNEREIGQFPIGPNRAAHIAGRFAAKEAVLKVLGTGQGAGISFTDVIIERANGAPPRVALVGRAAEVTHAARIQVWLLSISHADGFAMASALAFRPEG